LALVRWPLVSGEFVRDVVLNEPLLLPMPRRLLLTMPEQMREGILATYGETTRPDAESSPKKIPQLFALCGADQCNGDYSVEWYDPSTNSWTATKPIVRRQFSPLVSPVGAVLDGKLYITSNSWATRVDRFDPLLNMWEEIGSLRQYCGTHRYCIAALDGKLYVAGESSFHGTLEVYDPSSDVWTAAAAMTENRRNAGAAVMGGKLYVAGGNLNDGTGRRLPGTLSSVECYDPLTNAVDDRGRLSGQWTTVAPMITAREQHAIAALDGKLYACGGWIESNRTALTSVERYDPLTDAWETVAPMKTARSESSAAVLDGKLYVAGGNAKFYSDDNRKTGYRRRYLCSVERYDPSTNLWEEVAPMINPRNGFVLGSFD
jgi:hypothetical protein